MPNHAPFNPPSAWSTRTVPRLHGKLLTWFDAHHRPLPWRANRDPYRIWVSEVMLQQTTVAAVGGYFDRFLARFPNVESLADADEQEVLRYWEGLGYYRRARHLHAAAKQLAARRSDSLLDDPAVWSGLPGVGRYIFGAVLSQAFDQRWPIVEANSLRVLSRLLGYRGEPRQGAGRRWIWSAAEALLPTSRVGDYNQALMELGALVCTPAAPKCESCPIRADCVARCEGLQHVIPPPKAVKPLTTVREVGIVVWHRSKVLLCRRPESARWANMWEAPHAESLNGEDVRSAATRIARELTGLEVRVVEELLTIRHGVTRWSIELTCLEAQKVRGRFKSHFYTDSCWVEVERLGEYPVSSPQRKLMNALTH